ncbi:Hypothetical protein CINCED_3A017612 [Cinara cedri]|uniref:Uncharacterized protein n=1 Tax=Cinara cedri TaxID=506608 RepID=A0A5E4M180_9HEMI|nr:Hypothetical protein CINCED_3A017612 [Cinara cedri]
MFTIASIATLRPPYTPPSTTQQPTTARNSLPKRAYSAFQSTIVRTQRHIQHELTSFRYRLARTRRVPQPT